MATKIRNSYNDIGIFFDPYLLGLAALWIVHKQIIKQREHNFFVH